MAGTFNPTIRPQHAPSRPKKFARSIDLSLWASKPPEGVRRAHVPQSKAISNSRSERKRRSSENAKITLTKFEIRPIV
jgi:hypothetical protein